MSSAPCAPTILDDDPPPCGVPSQSLHWPDDPEARLIFVMRDQSAYIVGIQRGADLSGTKIVEAFRTVAGERRLKVIGVDFMTIGFWEKMLERQLIDDWSMESPEMLL